MSIHQIYLIILLENQVFTPDLLVGKLSYLDKPRDEIFTFVSSELTAPVKKKPLSQV